MLYLPHTDVLFMAKILKNAIITILIALVGAFLFLVALNNLASIFIAAIGILFIYYLILFLAVLKFIKSNQAKNSMISYALYLLFIIPIFWALFDLEGFVNFLMQGVSLDMK